LAFKVVGVDENSSFPARVEERLTTKIGGQVNRGGANGVAPLDAGSRVPDANLPTRLGASELSTTIAASRPETVAMAVKSSATAVQVSDQVSPAVSAALRSAPAAGAMQFTGVVGSFIASPGTPFNVANDLDVRALVSMDDWTPTPASGTAMTLVSRGEDSGGSQFKFEINNLGSLLFRWSPTGSATFTAKSSTANLGSLPNGGSTWVRVAFDVDNGAAQSEVYFYTSADGQNWVPFGSTVKTAGVVKFVTSSDPLHIGSYAASGVTPLTGRVSEVVVLNGIDGPTLGHWKAGVHPYTDAQSNVWSITGAGVTLASSRPSTLTVIPGRAHNEWQHNAASFGGNLTEWGGYQFAAFWGSDRYLRVAKRAIGSADWADVSFQGVAGAGLLNAQVAMDGHNVVAIHADSDGYLHVAGNMHGDWIKYMRSTLPGDLLGGWSSPAMIQPAGSKTGTDEGLVTYPRFLTNPVTGQLFFMYRNGSSGNGNTYLNKYDTTGKVWSRVGMIFNGSATSESAYENTPVFDEAGVLHLSFTWAASGSGFNDRTDVCYMKSADGGTTWTTISGAAVTLPVTHTSAPVILPAGTGDGLLNQCGMTVDGKGYPHIAHFWAPDGNRNIWHLYWNGTAWAHEQVTDLTQSGLDWTSLSRPAIVHYQGRLLIIWRHQWEGLRGYLWASDVTVPGKRKHAVLAKMDLREWEPAPDYRAIRRGSLNLLVTRVNAQVPAAIAGYADANWSTQPVGVLTVDLTRFDQRTIHNLPKEKPSDP